MKKFYIILLMLGILFSNSAYCGDGSQENPFTVSEAINLATSSDMFWVQGYVVGGRYNDFEQPWDNDYGVSIAESSSETNLDNCFQIKLETANNHRTLWGLNSNPSIFGTEIKAHGFRDTYGGYPSFEGVDDIAEASGGSGGGTTVTVSTPSISPAGGNYTTAQTITLSCSTTDAIIYYTTNGDTPTNTSTEYKEPFIITETSTIKAIAIKVEESSAIVSTEYSIQISSTNTLIPYEQNFTVDLGNFTQVSETGDEVWKWGSFDDGCAVMSGYNAGSKANIDWLISPTFDLSTISNAKLSFNEAINYITSYADLQVLFSTDYDGNSISSATWDEIAVTGRSAGDNWDFVSIDSISLSAYEGQTSFTFAFKYTSTATGSSTWEISKVVLTGKEALPIEPSNHVTNFTAVAASITETSIELAWNENDGTVLADGYLLLASTDSIAAPENGTVPADDLDLSDGEGNVKLAHGTTSYTFSNCTEGTSYNFSIFPFVETVDTIAYKTIDVPTTTATTQFAIQAIKAPHSFEAKVKSTSQINLSWEKNSSEDEAIVAYMMYEEVNEILVDSTVYAKDDTLTNGAIVIYKGSETNFSHLNLNESTYYYYKIWTVSSNRYSESVSAQSATLSEEPATAVLGFELQNISKTDASLVWNSAANNSPDGYVLLVSETEANLITPIDGTDISGDLKIVDGFGAAKVSGSDTSFVWQNLSPATTYYFTIFPYSNSGEFIDYKIEDAPIINNTTLSGIKTPNIIPEAGEYSDSLSVEITCDTPNATIYYTLNGEEPDSTSTIYTTAFTFYKSSTVKAIAILDSISSEITTATYTISVTPIEVALPLISPSNLEFSDSVVVSITCETAGAHIYFTTDGSDPNKLSTLYEGTFTLFENATINAIAYIEEFASNITTQSFVIIETVKPVEVSTLAELRAGETDGTLYHYNGTATVTFAMTFRNQKFIQDESAAILIDDNTGAISEAFTTGDGIIDLTGTLYDFNGLLEFIPTNNASKATAMFNVIPQTVEISEFNNNFEIYESELVKVEKLNIELITFANGTDYTIKSGDEGIVVRSHFYDVDYIGTSYENKSVNFTGIALWNSNQAKLVPRNSTDIEIRTGVNEMFSSIKIYTFNKNIAIDGIPENTTATVYDIYGRLITQVKSNNPKQIIPVNKSGIYIVRLSGQTDCYQKVAIQ